VICQYGAEIWYKVELVEIKPDFKTCVDNLYEARYFESDPSVPGEVRNYYLLPGNDIRISVGELFFSFRRLVDPNRFEWAVPGKFVVWKASCLKLKSRILVGRRSGSDVVSSVRPKKRKKGADDISAFRSGFVDLCRRYNVTEALVRFDCYYFYFLIFLLVWVCF
jgi:hypothetical protein